MDRARHSRIIIAAVAALLLVGGALGFWWNARQHQPRPLEEMLWVCDWEMRQFHGPGTDQQSAIAKILRERGLGDTKFSGPVLYRMGGSATGNGKEGILLQPFGPKNPAAARVMRRERN
jgi:hypothetical protein